MRNLELKNNAIIITVIFYFLCCWHFSGIIFDRKNLIYYPQFSKEADKYKINISALFIRKSLLPSCNISQKMLIGIISMPSEIERREAIRKSWANNTNVNKRFTKVVFIIGKTDSQKISIESAKYQDIIFTEIYENYYNLSLKTFAVFDFAYKQCFHAECIIKTDSDNVLNVAGFEDLCQRQITTKKYPRGYIGGYCNVSLNIHRETGNKWHIPYYVYAEEKLPTYCSSGIYAYFGQNSWKSIYKSVFYSQFFLSSNMRHLPEDMIFSGILANYTGIPRIDIPGFSYNDLAKIGYTLIMFYEFPVGDELVFSNNSFTTEQLITSLLFCSDCVFGEMNEADKHLMLTVTMHISFYLAICFTVIHLSFILHICNFHDIKLTTYKSAITCCTFIVSLFGYIMSAAASVVIKEEPGVFMFYDLSVIIGTLQLLVHMLWLVGMISIAKDEDDEIYDVDENAFFV